jgi:hypothetical protein
MSTEKQDKIAEAIVRGMAYSVAKDCMADVIRQMIDDGEIVPYIGFYKHCRECGINLHDTGNYLRDIVRISMEKKKRFRDD